MRQSAHEPQHRDERSDLRLILACAVGGALVCLALVWLVSVKSAQLQAGYRIHDLQTELSRLHQERATLEVERAALRRPARLAHVARTLFSMSPPDVDRAVMLEDKP